MPKKLNPYFELMLSHKKKNSPSFTYKGNTYVRTLSGKNGLVIYKKK